MPSALSSVFSVREYYKGNMGKMQEDRVNVEKSMFKAHTYHFLLSAAKASLFPFLTLYFRLLGLTATQVGLVFAAQAFIRLWCAPLWTACAKACRKKKFVLMFSTFILLATSLCLSLAPPADPENSPLYCKGPLQQLEPGQTSEHLGPQEDNDTLNAIVPIGNETAEILPVETDGDGNENTETETKEDEVNKDVDEGREKEKLSPTTTAAPTPTRTKAVTTPSSTTVPTTTTTAATTTTTRSARRHGHNKHVDQEDDKTAELADKLQKLGIGPDDLEQLSDVDLDNMSEDDLDNLLNKLLEGNKDGQSVDDTANDRDSRYNYNYKDYENADKRWQSREKRDNEEKGQDEDNEESGDTEEDQMSTWDELYGSLGKGVREYKTFAFVFGLVIAGELFAAPVDKLADDCWFEYLDVLDVVERYGGHRVWRLVGYILLPAFVGTLVEKTNCILMHNVPHFMIHFFMFAAFAALAFVAAFGYPVSQNKRTPKQSRFGKGVRILCCDIHSMTLTITIFLLGVMYACIQNFLLWKVQDVGGNEIVIGTSITVSAVSALFMYIISNGLIKRITHVGAIVLAMITLAGRLVFYSFLWTPWLVLAGEALHGFSFTLLWRAVEMYPDFRINPFIMDRSAFTMINVVYTGLGIGVGSAISGYLYDQFGFSLLFQGASVAITAWCAIFLLLQKCVKRKMKVRYAKLLQDDRGIDDSSSDDEDWLEVAMKSGSK